MIWIIKKTFQKVLWTQFGITNIYNNASEYNAKPLSHEIFFYENNTFSVTGIIEINKLNISYPILSNMNTELLKIAPCRFYGPLPNEVRESLYSCT